jgi:hypothetical protein
VKEVPRLLRRTLIAVLCGYWLIFLAYTIKNVIQGGPAAVVGWYKHISVQSGLLVRWNWRAFIATQLAILGITLILYFWDRAASRHRHLS